MSQQPGATGPVRVPPAVEGCAEAPRGPGRPRSPECDRAILGATLELLAEVGFSGLTMEGVSARAGVGKATVYRRWSSKSALVVDAVSAFSRERVSFVDTGSAREDLRAFMGSLVDVLRHSPAGLVMSGLVAEFPRHPELADAFRQGFVAPRRALLVDVLRRGVDRGELRADLDLDLVADAAVALIQHRWLVTGMALDDGLPDRVVALLFQGVAAGR